MQRFSHALIPLAFACGTGISSVEESSDPPMFPAPAPGAPNNPAAPVGMTPAAPSAPSTPNAPPPPAAPVAPSNTGTAAWQAPPLDPTTPVGIHGQLRVQGTALVGEDGAPVQLRGISTMWLNWEDRYSTSKEGLRWMRDNWGITLYRAALGIEPEGAYLQNRERALSQLRQIVHNAIDLGVYVLIDWHDHNAHEHESEAIEFFSEVAAEFGSFPHVLYETFNEPELIDWSAQIKPYHEAVVPAIRAADPDGVIILGTRQWSQRVDEAADDPVSGTNLMYTVHFYACDHGDEQRSQAQAAYDKGLALFVTEWGATPADGGAAEPRVCADEAQAWHDFLDARSIGWAAWKLDGCGDSSCLFSSDSAPREGGWTSQWLNGHAQFVVDRLLQ